MTASTGELHTASGEWLSNVFLARAKFAVRRPKIRWVRIRHILRQNNIHLFDLDGLKLFLTGNFS